MVFGDSKFSRRDCGDLEEVVCSRSQPTINNWSCTGQSIVYNGTQFVYKVVQLAPSQVFSEYRVADTWFAW